jgi:hypothetical protein
VLGASVGLGEWSFGAVYGTFLRGEGDLDEFDGEQAFGIYGQYDLGGGASVNGGIVRTYRQALRQADDSLELDNTVIGDFGIVLAF